MTNLDFVDVNAELLEIRSVREQISNFVCAALGVIEDNSCRVSSTTGTGARSLSAPRLQSQGDATVEMVVFSTRNGIRTLDGREASTAGGDTTETSDIIATIEGRLGERDRRVSFFTEIDEDLQSRFTGGGLNVNESSNRNPEVQYRVALVPSSVEADEPESSTSVAGIVAITLAVFVAVTMFIGTVIIVRRRRTMLKQMQATRISECTDTFVPNQTNNEVLIELEQGRG